MADQKISELTSAATAASADLLHIVQGGSNKKLTIANFLANVSTAPPAAVGTIMEDWP